MSKAVIFFAPGLEECEGLLCVDLLRRSGVEVTIAAVGGEKIVKSARSISVVADALAEELDYSAFDAAILPGGIPGVDNLKADATVRKVCTEFAAAGKVVAAICAAPSVLAAFGILQGKKATVYPGMEDKLTAAGAEYTGLPITLDGKKLENFLIYNFPCKGVELLPFSGKKPAGDQPVFHRGYFNVSNPKDTYLDMRDGWKKGVVWVNGRNLGRFWFIGSQQALYCPGEYLKPGKNEIVVLDVDGGFGTVKGVKEAIYEVNRDPAMADVFRVGKPVAPAAGQLVHKGSFAKGADQQEIKFRAPVQARYIAIVSKNAHDNGPHAAIAELNFLDASGNLLPREQWSVVYADSHETTGEAAQAGLVMDNQPTTYWHTKWQGDNPQHPHMIVLDLGKVQKLSGFRYLPRQNRENGRIKDYEVYASPKPFKPAK